MTPEVARALAEAGPWAVVLFIGGVIAITGVRVIRALWIEHLKADQDDRDQRDKALAALATAIDGNKLAATAQADMARAWDERNKADAARRRQADR